MTSARARMLTRIREALSTPASDGVHTESLPEADGAHLSYNRVTPIAADGVDAMTDQFSIWSERLRTEFIVREDLEGARSALLEVCGMNDVAIATHRGELMDAVCAGLDIAVRIGDENDIPHRDLASCEVSISECEALIANTGSILITARMCGGRALSVLPPHHVVLARAKQLVPDLAAGYGLLREKYGADDLPAFISLITGPSRTGDIERILVLGAHGPKRLTVILSRE